ncbi:MAG: hypothetical protein HY000_20085 [Planctomycetes bacterium]|nr:hypothetical protein [Planctomycetota bacterium]
MGKRPRSITVISWIFIAVGCVALAAALLPFDAAAAQLAAEIKARHLELWFMLIARVLAVVCGVFMLYGFNWARWLLVIWLAYHLVLGALHGPLGLFVHSVLTAVVAYYLFRPRASEYFRGTMADI